MFNVASRRNPVRNLGSSVMLGLMLFVISTFKSAWADECQNWQMSHPEWIFCDDFEDGNALGAPGPVF